MGTKKVSILEKEVKKFLELFSPKKIAVAVSGGVDSVVLFYILYKYISDFFYELYVIHINHNLRGLESERDEKFVKELCKKYNIKGIFKKIEVSGTKKREGGSIEEVARRLRYKKFEEICKEYNIPFLFMAHHKNDDVETILFNILRGCSLNGLKGIPTVRELTKDIKIIRPFLDFSRDFILEYAKQNDINFVEDSSNNNITFTRNFIRHKLFPQFYKINPNFLDHIINLKKDIDNLFDFFDSLYEDIRNQIEINPISLKIKIERFPKNMYLITELLKRIFDEFFSIKLTRAYLTRIAKMIISSYNGIKKIIVEDVIVIRDQTYLILQLPTNIELNNSKEVEVCIPGEVYLDNYCLKATYVDNISNIDFNAPPDEFFFISSDFQKRKLIFRYRKPGDYILLNKGKKKLKKYFIDEKVPWYKRNYIPLLAEGNRIYWIYKGFRDNRLKPFPDEKAILLRITSK